MTLRNEKAEHEIGMYLFSELCDLRTKQKYTYEQICIFIDEIAQSMKFNVKQAIEGHGGQDPI